MQFKKLVVYSTAVTGCCYVGYRYRKLTNNYRQKQHEQSLDDETLSPYIYLENRGNYFEPIETSLSVEKRISLPIYWKILKLCKSKNHKVRLKAVESLSKLTSLEKWQYMAIAQACDLDTSIGLARSHNASPYFFLHPPFRDLEKGNLQNELYLLLTSLQFSCVNMNIQNLIKQVIKSAKHLLKNGYLMDFDIGDSPVMYHSQQKEKSMFLYIRLCLKTVLACSTESSLRIFMMEKRILYLLLKVLQAHRNDIEIHSLIAQILANLALEEKFRNNFHVTGWIGILSEWKNSPYVNINLPAAKALANLDKDDIPHPIYEDSIYVLSPLCRLSQREILADIIFVHGMHGGTFWTWRQHDTQKIKSPEQNKDPHCIATSKQYSSCWPKDWLAVDIPSLRIISVDYKSNVSNWGSSFKMNNMERREKELIDKLLLSGVGNRPIIWVAHSMGGLIVKQMLSEAFQKEDKKFQLLLQKTIGIIFYSVPHKGSEIANMIDSASLIFQPSSDIAELKKDAPKLLSLHEKFKDIVSKYDIPILSFGEMKKSRWGLSKSILVPSDSADPGFGEFFMIPEDHLSTCKPLSSTSPEYLKVLNFVKESLSRIDRSEARFLKIPYNILEISKVICLIP